MLHSGSKLVAPRELHETKLYTIVLDLDETVVYARDGPLYARANLKELLCALNDVAEVIVWTAGVRMYAKAILEEINAEGYIKHLVYRHRNWYNPEDYTKDLRKLGRDIDYVLIVENTPDCVRANPTNGIIVEDFEVTSKGSQLSDRDQTFVHLMRLVMDLGKSNGMTVPQFLAQCPLLKRQLVHGSDGQEIPIFYLTSKRMRLQRPLATGKVLKNNRDKQPAEDSQMTKKKSRIELRTS